MSSTEATSSEKKKEIIMYSVHIRGIVYLTSNFHVNIILSHRVSVPIYVHYFFFFIIIALRQKRIQSVLDNHKNSLYFLMYVKIKYVNRFVF